MSFFTFIKIFAKFPLRFLKKIYYYVLCGFYFVKKKPTVVIHMDGGLCSQMHEFALGELFKDNGFCVRYDLNWFKEHGRCCFGKDARFFEIDKLYPRLRIKKASSVCTSVFDKYFRVQEIDVEKCIAARKNLYLVNDRPLKFPSDRMVELMRTLFSNPAAPTDKENILVGDIIRQDLKSCAVHVRRGDLADPKIAKDSGYGNCVTDKYYKTAVSIIKKLIPDVTFYFFSDDLAYVKNTLLPFLGDIKYRIVDENKGTVLNGGGYKDFYLIFLCKNQVCSLGSFGVDAAILNNNKDKVVVATKELGQSVRNMVVLDFDGNVKRSTIDLGSD